LRTGVGLSPLLPFQSLVHSVQVSSMMKYFPETAGSPEDHSPGDPL
jgi:hypothetical protein